RRAESPSHWCQQIPGTGHDHHGGAHVGWRLRARQVPVAGRLSSSRIQAGTESPPYEPQPCSHLVGTTGLRPCLVAATGKVSKISTHGGDGHPKGTRRPTDTPAGPRPLEPAPLNCPAS